MNHLDWQSISVILIIIVTAGIFIRRFFRKKSAGSCSGSGCHCPKPGPKK